MTTAKINVISSQYKKPLLEFSGSCAGCAETSYARLITQLFGERMYISNATGCSSIWGGPAATSPYTVNKEGHGPAWANSLFEDNAEHGFGIYLGQKAIRNRLIAEVKEMICDERATGKFKAAADAYLATLDDGEKNGAATKALLAELEDRCDCAPQKDIVDNKEYLAKKSVWIFGGDGWAYDIGFGGLDHVLASGEDVNVMVFDTEVYSNTGGQASKASQIGQVAQFAAAGKEIKKKSLAEIAMSYGYVYVAQIAMGADNNQTLKALRRSRSLSGTVADHRLCSVRDALHQGRHDQLPEGDEEGCRLRLLEPVPLQPRAQGRRQEPVQPRLQGSDRELTRTSS